LRTLLLLTIVLSAIVFPILTARASDPRRGMRRLLFLILAFNAVYLFYVTRLHPEWFVPQRP